MEINRTKIIFLWIGKTLPILIGAGIGYAYYYFIGCSKGCAITGNPWTSTFWGALIGSALVNWKSISSLKEKKEN